MQNYEVTGFGLKNSFLDSVMFVYGDGEWRRVGLDMLKEIRRDPIKSLIHLFYPKFYNEKYKRKLEEEKQRRGISNISYTPCGSSYPAHFEVKADSEEGAIKYVLENKGVLESFWGVEISPENLEIWRR